MFKKILVFILSSLGLFASNQGQVAKANEIEIWYQTFGKKENPAVLLIMGGCCSGALWHKDFCEQLAKEGFYVIRYDHRDTGLSTSFDFEKNPYSLMDMTKDAVGVLDAAGVEKAHLFGISMGGFISEIMAAHFSERVHSILVMASTCELRPMNLAYAGVAPEEHATASGPASYYLDWMKEFMKLSPSTEEEKLAHRLEGWNRLNGSKIPLKEASNREIHKDFLEKFHHPQGILNHIAMLRSEESENLLRTVPSKIQVPTIVLQGSEDPIFLPDHGELLHRSIPNSTYHCVEGMGHIPNEHFYNFYIDLIKQQM